MILMSKIDITFAQIKDKNKKPLFLAVFYFFNFQPKHHGH